MGGDGGKLIPSTKPQHTTTRVTVKESLQLATCGVGKWGTISPGRINIVVLCFANTLRVDSPIYSNIPLCASNPTFLSLNQPSTTYTFNKKREYRGTLQFFFVLLLFCFHTRHTLKLVKPTKSKVLILYCDGKQIQEENKKKINTITLIKFI